MSRYHSYEDDDEYRLPEGFERIGYDAKTQTYYYRSSDGRTYTGEPGVRYGPLRPTTDTRFVVDQEDTTADYREPWRYRLIQKRCYHLRWRIVLLRRRTEKIGWLR